MIYDATNEVMYGRIGRLRDTYRYSAQPSIFRENVAEHSFWTAMIGVTIAYELHEHEGISDRIAEVVALNALVHDIEECMTGDLVRDMKYANSEFREAVLKIEREFLTELLSPMKEVGDKIFHRWANAKSNTLAGQIVSLADALSVISYCTRERMLGNTALKEIRDSCAELIWSKFGQDAMLWPIAKESIDGSFERWPE